MPFGFQTGHEYGKDQKHSRDSRDKHPEIQHHQDRPHDTAGVTAGFQLEYLVQHEHGNAAEQLPDRAEIMRVHTVGNDQQSCRKYGRHRDFPDKERQFIHFLSSVECLQSPG